MSHIAYGFFLAMVSCSMLRLLDAIAPSTILPWPFYAFLFLVGIGGTVSVGLFTK